MKKLILINAVIAFLLLGALAGSYWFRISHVGWLIEDVIDTLAFQQDWQLAINDLNHIQHPAVVHYQPKGCLCRALNASHSQEITRLATKGGFSVYQLNSEHSGLGKPLKGEAASSIGPLIGITNAEGRLAYIGAYSDGVRCNTGTSMVDVFLASPDRLPASPVVGLDVQTCRCL